MRNVRKRRGLALLLSLLLAAIASLNAAPFTAIALGAPGNPIGAYVVTMLVVEIVGLYAGKTKLDILLVPLGALTGIEAFAGLGPRIHFRIIPVSSVSCDFSSAFESVGINQTKHTIYLNVIADISIVMPSRTERFSVLTEIMVGEFVIVGDIPQTFLQTDIFGDKAVLSP